MFTLTGVVLKNDGYLKQRQSELLPDLPLEAFCRYITYYDQYDAVQEFRQVLQPKQNGTN